MRWRREYVSPILVRFIEVLLRVQAMTDKYPIMSQMMVVVNYFLNEWVGIKAIPMGGDNVWDNNHVECLNCAIAFSRKNFIFFGSHDGAGFGAIFYFLACSCRLHKINFFEYLSDVLNFVAEMSGGAPPVVF